MKRSLLTVALVGAAATAWAGPAMKPGLWEIHTTRQVMDGQDTVTQMAAAQKQMQQMMASLPPEQRKQAEAMMPRHAMPGGGVQRICVSAEMAARDKPVLPLNGRCEPSKVSRGGNTMTFEFDCTVDGQHMVGKGESMISGDTIGSKMDMTMTDARGQHSMQTESQMKFLGADCQGVKPADQIAREMQAKMPVKRGNREAGPPGPR